MEKCSWNERRSGESGGEGHQDRPGREEGGVGRGCGREEGKEEGGKKGGKRDRAIALQENFKNKLMIGPRGGPPCFDFVAIRPVGCSEKVSSYTRTRKSAFYFFGKLYFRMAFRKPFLNGQREKTEGFEREKESKG